MKHDIKIIGGISREEALTRANCVRDRKFAVSIDNIITQATVKFIEFKGYKEDRYPYLYRLELENKLISRSKDYNQIRIAILLELGKIDYEINVGPLLRLNRDINEHTVKEYMAKYERDLKSGSVST